MHQALLVEEIQLPIFNQILENKTLYALARTCQTFAETALDVLWCDLDCFPRLIQCMPKDLWMSELKEEERSLVITLRRPISSADWVIFQKYSRRVRSVLGPNQYSFGNPLWRIDDALLFALCAPSVPSPLLPNLTSLVWRVGSDAHLNALHRLFPSSLASLNLLFRSEREFGQVSFDLNSAIQFPFNQVFPSLKSLAVDAEHGITPSLLEGLQPSISQLQNLGKIHWPHLRSETVMSLAQLPALTQATFKFPSDFSQYIGTLPPSSSMQNPAFSKLRMLMTKYVTPAAVLSFLGYFALDLDFISVVLCGSPSPSQIGDFFSSIASSPSRNIRSLQISDSLQRITEQNRTEYQPLTKYKFVPLLQLKELQHFRVNLQCSIILNDADLLEMAEAWPNIITLWLDGHPHPGSHVNPGPYALVALLDRCPKLSALSIEVDFSTIDRADFDPLSIADSFDSRHTRNGRELRDLRFGPYNIAYPDAIAKFLACFVPDQARIDMNWPWTLESEPDIHVERWNLAKQIFNSIRST
ncbi:hypothetical protein BJ138DRAFT_1120117 [Hygrophoropsis aurantiaca]|uniref:Uncharacterized protein n=1 Tax=Hygrophoropsis aurantiaca TaxID=72124 RepID=A0ACB7ZSI7_9AGAM|nr:hypothetical protein BJ138DRAFT_1120117 [Hygrophoropsis aurantiaca]